MFEIVFALLLLPFELVGILRRARMTNDQRANELAIASQGAGFVALAALAVWMVGPDDFFPWLRAAPAVFPVDWPHWFPALAFAVFVFLGLYWFLIGAHRAWRLAGFRDGRVITGALVKIGVAVAAALLIWIPPSSWPHGVRAWLYVFRTMPLPRNCILVVLCWLLVTGAAKLLLVALPAAGNALRRVAAHQRKKNKPMIPAGRSPRG